MSQKIIPVIICGGSGTRLWPLSRESQPKQFIPLIRGLSTFQQVLQRVDDPALFGRTMVVTNAEFRFAVAEQIRMAGVRRTSCLSRWAGIPVPPLRLRPSLQAGAIPLPCCWCSPPIISCAIPRDFARPAGMRWVRPPQAGS